jgi:hypothetical protein
MREGVLVLALASMGEGAGPGPASGPCCGTELTECSLSLFRGLDPSRYSVLGVCAQVLQRYGQNTIIDS